MTALDKAPDGWLLAAWAAWLLVTALSLRRAPWELLKNSAQSHLWWGMIVVLVLFWSMVIHVKPGLTIHLLGATALTLCFGPYLAFVALVLVLAAVDFNSAGNWDVFAIDSLVAAGVGVAASFGFYRLVDRWLPKHFFVYVFVNGFFGAAFAMLAVGLATVGMLALRGAYSLDYLMAEYLPSVLLLSFSEAWLTGMAITLLVVYRPDVVATFNQDRYIAKS